MGAAAPLSRPAPWGGGLEEGRGGEGGDMYLVVLAMSKLPRHRVMPDQQSRGPREHMSECNIE